MSQDGVFFPFNLKMQYVYTNTEYLRQLLLGLKSAKTNLNNLTCSVIFANVCIIYSFFISNQHFLYTDIFL